MSFALLFFGDGPCVAMGAIFGAQVTWFDLSNMLLDAHSKNRHKHMSSTNIAHENLYFKLVFRNIYIYIYIYIYI